MKIANLAMAAMMAIVTEATACAANVGQPGQTVAVCLPRLTDQDVAPRTRGLAKHIAGKIYAGIGVTITWHVSGKDCPVGAIEIGWSTETAPSDHPGALAYAMPYQGTRIVVFYDRVTAAFQSSTLPHLLAHVLAHEIGHVLQGTSQHSESGVMQARWTGADYSRMERKPLSFTEFDAASIRRGLASRLANANPAR